MLWFTLGVAGRAGPARPGETGAGGVGAGEGGIGMIACPPGLLLTTISSTSCGFRLCDVTAILTYK